MTKPLTNQQDNESTNQQGQASIPPPNVYENGLKRVLNSPTLQFPRTNVKKIKKDKSTINKISLEDGWKEYLSVYNCEINMLRKEREEKQSQTTNFNTGKCLSRHTSINLIHRIDYVRWLAGTGEHLKCSPATIHLSITLLDKVLCLESSQSGINGLIEVDNVAKSLIVLLW